MKKNIYAVIISVTAFAAINAKAQSANRSLSNLTATKINTSLLPDSNALRNLGSASISWNNIYLKSGLYMNKKKFISITGTSNTFIGSEAGKSITTGSYNAAFGNTALYSNTTGGYNTAAGSVALYYNTTGASNTAIGSQALYTNATGSYNTALGESALYHNYDGQYNTASGKQALYNNTSGSYNSAHGFFALGYNTTGNYNTANGYFSLLSNNVGSYNSASGYYAMYANTAGSYNTAGGAYSLYSNTTGAYNTADGFNTLTNNTTGLGNTATGYLALTATKTAYYNTAIGFEAGDSYDNGYNNVFVGANTDVDGAGYYNVIAIGQGTVCTGSSQVTVGNGATASYRAYANWSNISDGRFKKNIKENVPGLAFINKLQPVTYTLDATGIDNFLHANQPQDKQINEQGKASMSKALQEKEKIIYTGFIAQDVEKTAKSLGYDFSGVDAAKNSKDLYGLRYAEFVVPLVKAVQELSKMNNTKDSLIQQQGNKINDLQNQLNELKTMMQTIISKTGTVNSSNNISLSSASLEQNIPNPSKGSTTVGYTLPQKFTTAQIMITDKNGKTLKLAPVSGSAKGTLNVDVSTLSSGIYNYSLFVDNKLIATKQMVIAK